MALAQKNVREITPIQPNGGSTSAVITAEQPTATEIPPQTSAPELSEKSTAKNDNTMYIIVGIIALVVGSAGYYFKIVKGKKNAAYDDEEDDNYGYDNSVENEETETNDDEDGGGEE
jgi:uncharacterized protein HemX